MFLAGDAGEHCDRASVGPVLARLAMQHWPTWPEGQDRAWSPRPDRSLRTDVFRLARTFHIRPRGQRPQGQENHFTGGGPRRHKEPLNRGSRRRRARPSAGHHLALSAPRADAASSLYCESALSASCRGHPYSSGKRTPLLRAAQIAADAGALSFRFRSGQRALCVVAGGRGQSPPRRRTAGPERSLLRGTPADFGVDCSLVAPPATRRAPLGGLCAPTARPRTAAIRSASTAPYHRPRAAKAAQRGARPVRAFAAARISWSGRRACSQIVARSK